MTLALDNYASVESNLFVKIDVDYYKTSPEATPTTTTLLFSDRLVTTTVAGQTYTGLGQLVAISSSNSDIRATNNEVSISISGIPDASMSAIVNSKIKGSPVTIYRAIFNSSTSQILSISGNPAIRFKGYVNNIGYEEEYDVDNRTGTNTVVFICNNIVDVFENKIAGRRTNPSSQKKFYPSDLSFDKIPNLENTRFDFGVKK